MRSVLLATACGLLAAVVAGCDGIGPATSATQPSAGQMPAMLAPLLPTSIRIHPFTGMRTFDDSGGIRGIDLRVEAKDAWGDSTKAIGDFRFELYSFRRENSNPKGAQLDRWDVSLSDPKANALHWDPLSRTYKFNLQWSRSIPVGRRFVIVAHFTSPFTKRLSTEYVFYAGQ